MWVDLLRPGQRLSTINLYHSIYAVVPMGTISGNPCVAHESAPHWPFMGPWDSKNPLLFDMVDRYLRRMGDKTIPNSAGPRLEWFYPPWVAGIDVPQSMRFGFFVSFTNKNVFNL